MSWQSLENIYLQKTAFKNVEKLPRQTINEATASEVISLIKDLDSQGLLDKEKDLEMFKKYLTTKPFSKKITDYLTNQNLNEGTIGQGDIRKYILDILTEYNDVENYSNYIDNPKKFSSLPFRGILLNEIEDISNDSIKALINLIGSESGRGVGRAEVALATLFDDVKMSTTKGDLSWDGNYLEVKGSDARLGKRDRATNFASSKLGLLSSSNNIDTRRLKERLDLIISELADTDGVDKKELYNAVKEFVEDEDPHSTIEFGENINLNNPLDIRKALTKIYFNNYAEHEGVDYFIFVNTKLDGAFSRYIIFSKSQIPELIDKKLIKSGTIKFTDLDPSLGTI
jgi:hypothetical protein